MASRVRNVAAEAARIAGRGRRRADSRRDGRRVVDVKGATFLSMLLARRQSQADELSLSVAERDCQCTGRE